MANKRISQLPSIDEVGPGDLLIVSRPSPTVTITATTISAAASDNSFSDSGSGLLAAGFAVGDQVRVQDAAAANNLFSATVQALTAGKMTILSPEGDAIVNQSAGAAVTITKWESCRVSAATLAQGSTPIYRFEVAISNETTPLTTGAAKVTFHWPVSGTVTEVWAGLTTPQASGSVVTLDVNAGASSILSTKLTIDNTEETSLTAATPAVLDDAEVTQGAKGTIDIDQVGSGTVAAGAKVYFTVALDA